MDKKTILVVDDDLGFLRLLEDKFELNEQYSKEINLLTFGVSEGEIVREDVKESFLNYLEKNKESYIADVIFCDYDLGKGSTVLDVLHYMKDFSSLPPVVVMTANPETSQADAVKSIENGARGYIIKSSDRIGAEHANDYFLQELVVSTIRVDQEHKQRSIHNVITEISKESETDDVETLATNFVRVFTQYYPYFTILVREYKNSELELLSSNLPSPILQESIQVLKSSEASFLFDFINGDKGIVVKNNIQDMIHDLPSETKMLLKPLNLQKGILIRVGSRDNPLGTISIYCGDKNRDFGEEQKNHFLLASQSITRDWKLLNERSKSQDIMRFINNMVKENDEKEIWKKLCTLVHKYFNQNSEQTKTTIKVSTIGSDILKREYCDGAACDTEKEVRISANTVSSWVYRHNHYCYITSDDFIDINEEPKRLKDGFKNSLCQNGRDREIEFNETLKGMLSEICLPISLAMKTDDEVFAILNLESNFPYAYGSDEKAIIIREEIENLITVCAKRVNNIRQKKFTESMIKAISYKSYINRFKASKSFLAEFIGYSVFTVVIKKDNKLKLEYYELNPKKDDKTYKSIKNKLERSINAKSMIKDFFEAVKEYKYIPNGDIEDNFGTIEDIESNAQFLARLKAGNKTIGVVSFEFDIVNPLSERKIELLKGFIAWFNRDINENINYENLRNEVDYYRDKTNHNWYFKNLSHMINTEITKVKSSLDVMEIAYKKKDKKLFDSKYSSSKSTLSAIATFPQRFISTTDNGSKYLEDVLDDVENDFKSRFKEKRVIAVLENVLVKSKHTSFVYRIFFHTVLNAFEEKSVTNISVQSKVDTERDMLILTIKDDGNGFVNLESNATTKSTGGGFGLNHIKDIIEYELKGQFSKSNENGAVIRIEIPVIKAGTLYEV